MSTDTVVIDQLTKDELLEELASFLYDVYVHHKETVDVIITAVDEEQIADNIKTTN